MTGYCNISALTLILRLIHCKHPLLWGPPISIVYLVVLGCIRSAQWQKGGWYEFYLELVYEIRNKGCDKVSLARLYTAPAEIKRRARQRGFAVRLERPGSTLLSGNHPTQTPESETTLHVTHPMYRRRFVRVLACTHFENKEKAKLHWSLRK